MKSLFFSCLLISATTLLAQTTTTWIGGAPGNATEWHDARNWSDNHVPDEFTKVIIKWSNSGHNAQPVIRKDAEVLSIEIHSGATLSLTKDAHLLIDGEQTFTMGIQLFGGSLVNQGQITLENIDAQYAQTISDQYQGNGLVIIGHQSNKVQAVAHRQQ